jgi:hypothetical protein
MKLLELFAGSRSIGKVGELLGFDVFSSDITPFNGINYAVDILDFNPKTVPFIPDIIWASPPCTGFSVAALGHHWTGGKGAYIPRTETAKRGIELVDMTLDIITYYTKCNLNLVWFLENPRGVLRKLDMMKYAGKRHTVTYCQYGDERMKPTDIWTNSTTWTPRPMCKNGDPCHVAAPRGSKTGTQGRSNAYERSKIPTELCFEILKSCIPNSSMRAA